MTSLKNLWFKARAAVRQALPPQTRRQILAFGAWIKEPAITLGLVLVATTAVARPFYVPSGSMEPTLQIGDDLLAAKYAYGYSRYSLPFGIGPSSTQRFLGRLPARGDVVVFRLPRDPSQTYVKRVIGLPGDHIQMLGGRLWINGQELALKPDGQGQVEGEDGSIATVPRFIETLPGGRAHPILKWTWSGPFDDTAVYVVPKDHLFMMGDNRDNSLDSRVAPQDGGVGYVPVENLIGRAEVVMGSVDYLNARSILAWPSEFRISRLFSGVR